MIITKNGEMEMEYLTDGVVNNGFSDDEEKNERVIREIEFDRNLMDIEEAFGNDNKLCRKKKMACLKHFVMEEFDNSPLETQLAILMENKRQGKTK